MRLALPALLALAAAGAAAQAPPPPPESPEPSFRSPVTLRNAVGHSWTDAAALVSPPDSGAVAGGEGRLVWTDPDPETDRVEVRVRHGAVDAVALTTSDPAAAAALERQAARLAARLGPPADGDFYTAAQLAALPGTRPYPDLAVRPERGQLVLRKPLAPPPAAAPPPDP